MATIKRSPRGCEGPTPELSIGAVLICPPTAVHFRGGEGGKALQPHSHPAAIVCPGGPERHISLLRPRPHHLCHHPPPRLSGSLSRRDLWSNRSSRLHKDPQLAFIWSLLPAVYILHFNSCFCAGKYRFHPRRSAGRELSF